MKIMLIKGASIMMGINQNEYLVVPLREGSELIVGEDGENVEVPNITASYRPDEQELRHLNNGGCIHLTLLGRQFPPMRMNVQPPPRDPENPDDVPYEQPEGHPPDERAPPLEGTTFRVEGTSAGLQVVEAGPDTTLKVGDVFQSVAGQMPRRIDQFNQIFLKAHDLDIKTVLAVIERGGHLWQIAVAVSNTPESAGSASEYTPQDLGPVRGTEDSVQ